MKKKAAVILMIGSMLALPQYVKADATQDCIDNAMYIYHLDAAICSTQYGIDALGCLLDMDPACIAQAALDLHNCLNNAERDLQSNLDACGG